MGHTAQHPQKLWDGVETPLPLPLDYDDKDYNDNNYDLQERRMIKTKRTIITITMITMIKWLSFSGEEDAAVSEQEFPTAGKPGEATGPDGEVS